MSFDPGYEIYHYTEGVVLPEKGTYYLVAGNGIFLHKDMGVLKGLVPVSGVDSFQDVTDKNVAWCGPKVPFDAVYKIKRFFRLVVEKYHSEACTILYLDTQTSFWKVLVPPQRVSHAGVHYERNSFSHDIGYIPVGTIHSHADFGAFHSGVDVTDEETFDGLHLTFGHNHKDAISVACSVVMNGTRVSVEPTSVLEGVNKIDGNYTLDDNLMEKYCKKSMDAEVDEWLKNVSKLEYSFMGLGKLW